MNNSIRISCDLTNLIEVRNFVREFLMPYALTENEVNLIVFAVDEISANLIIHANQKDNSKYIYLTITKEQNSFIFELSDQGVFFDGNTLDDPNLKHIIQIGQKGGIGLAMVKRIVDKLEFTTNDKGMNICRIQVTI
ncbi:ATP-binding protein [Adhaeribacter pallidiroseus]|uniref:Non-specific serine/threonine protein kinase n=1 Tax=Adhaeribacter pallidiroseus TaxID=2072847 RepID=A0A369QGH5_9BACT|nr:ATP-binding protein [Adhaeribacter pallidiroseus]RDC64023.1 Non-specific serine/threonine protein kinase [Adhaeribacter pallidiroseus]